MATSETIRFPIRQLSAQLANQIAAGEVVERPASIVKELIENSLDSAATSIEIEIQKGGLELIKIRDNGCGIPKQEIPLAVQAHCTSKISNFDDLTAIESMGFRGEALASIVSISQFEITSAIASEDIAWVWSNIKGISHANELIPASHPTGTSIEVRDIFFNTLARRKFLRSERTEFRYIEDVVKRIALNYFDIEIILKHNQRVVYRLPPATDPELRIKRIEKLLDKKFISDAIQVSYQASQLSMTGWLSNKNYSRGQTDMQYFYVNGRIVKDKIISHALRQVYQAVLPPGRFPAYVLNLNIDPQQVDVNVHPTKHEVRFRQSRLVHDFVNHVIEQSLNKLNSVSKSIDLSHANTENMAVDSFVAEPTLRESNTSYDMVTEDVYKPYIVDNASTKKNKNLDLLGNAIGFCKPYYLISSCSQGMVLVQLLRIQQYYVEQQWLSSFKLTSIDTKPFVFPLSIVLNPQLCDCVEKHVDMINSLGIDLSLQNKTTALLRAIPSFLNHSEPEIIIRQLLTSLQMEKEITAEKLISLLSRLTTLDESSEQQPVEYWNTYLRKLEVDFDGLTQESPFKNIFWRIMSVAELNKLFHANISTTLMLD